MHTLSIGIKVEGQIFFRRAETCRSKECLRRSLKDSLAFRKGENDLLLFYTVTQSVKFNKMTIPVLSVPS
jgi:hypothetical protein